MLTLTPAYGRDYKSRMAVLLDLTANKDFIIADQSHLWNGKPINLSQLREEDHKAVRVRYAGLRQIATFDISKNIE